MISVWKIKTWLQRHWRRFNDGPLLDEGEPPLRDALLGPEQLANHARATAMVHDLDPQPGPEKLLRRLDDNERLIEKSYQIVAEAVRQKRHVAPAAEWLLDNYYLIEKQIELAREHFPPGYSRKLPRLQSGPLKGYPRVYDLILELVSHTDGRVDLDNVLEFVQAYQQGSSLQMGELWAVPIMLRLTLLENLRRVVYRIAWRRGHRDHALEWSRRFLAVVQKNPKMFITELADFVRADPELPTPFIAELAASLQGIHPSLRLAIEWIEQQLSERGQTLEMIQQAESQDQAEDQVSVGNTITSLRTLGAIDWREFVESQSATEKILSRDPAGSYREMDFRTRDRYRHVVESLARHSRQSETEVAQAAVHLAGERREQQAIKRETHIGFFLIDKGRAQLEAGIGYSPPLIRTCARRLSGSCLHFFLAAVLLTSAVLALPLVLAAGYMLLPERFILFIIISLLVLLAISRSAISILNSVLSFFLKPRSLARLDFTAGLPPDQRTAVAIPTLIRSCEDVQNLLEGLELRFLANRSPNLYFGLLTDFADADEKEMPGDSEIVESAVRGVAELNRRYTDGDESPVFFLLHRPRQWNHAEQCWMGHERKRGKLAQLNRFILERDSSGFIAMEGIHDDLHSVKYVITLDTDTQLPPRTAARLVGTMAHPLNEPQFGPESRRIEVGYGILQPRLAVSITGAMETLYAKLFAGDVGIDPYTGEVSNLYHDMFGQGQFVGKGIYHVEAFQQVLGKCFPENRILSHDLIEGCYARCGFLNDVELIEENICHYLTDMKRRHRWTRGDWQILRWLLPSVPETDRNKAKNPLNYLCRWMIFDNLRRSLVPAAWLLALAAGWLYLPEIAFDWTLFLVLIFFLPEILRLLFSIPAKKERLAWTAHLRKASCSEGRQFVISALELITVPHQAMVYMDAVLRVLWRLFLSGRGLLEWQTADECMRDVRNSLTHILRETWVGPLTAAVLLPLLYWADGDVNSAMPLLLLWFFSPLAIWLISRPTPPLVYKLKEEEMLLLGRLARRTWTYFEDFVTQEENFLPPDNFQEVPAPVVATRTSPTNMGMGLLANLAARDFGYISSERMLERLQHSLTTMEALKRFHNHFYNWYDTRTCEPLHPFYISTVDSGNLCGNLITLCNGLRELEHQPVIPERWHEGLRDTWCLLLDEINSRLNQKLPKDSAHKLKNAVERVQAQIGSLTEVGDHMPNAMQALQRGLTVCRNLQSLLEAEDELLFWQQHLCVQYEDLLLECQYTFPWLADGVAVAERSAGLAGNGPLPLNLLNQLTKPMTLSEMAGLDNYTLEQIGATTLEPVRSSSRTKQLRCSIEEAAERARNRLRQLHELAARCLALSDVDFEFLYDRERSLLSIGYNLDAHRRDAGNYDLLASEARLASFMGIAWGKLPLEHWFHLGRQLAPGDGLPVLVSWSGSMFEYLMPNLLMPVYPGTLLYQSCRGAVKRQIRFGRAHKVPWGVSESGYNQFDAQMNYQYSAFGVPSLGLKRGLGADVVIAPYATVMALMVAPQHAYRNLSQLMRKKWYGQFGLYEAVDFTRNRLRNDEDYSVVRSYMAHHSGMSLLALTHVLLEQPMQRRFLADPQLRASLLLLQERIPAVQAKMKAGTTLAESPERLRPTETAAGSSRIFTTADTPTPELHLLSNGRYHVMISNSGAGYSRLLNLEVTRWREDVTRDDWGLFFYLRDVESGKVWSATGQPCRTNFDRYTVVYSQGGVEFTTEANGIETHCRIAVSPEDDVEQRKLTLTNNTSDDRIIELTTYAEVVLMHAGADAQHPAFQNLFVQTEAIENRDAVICCRRARASDETWPVLFHALHVHGMAACEDTSFETDRNRFVGRTRNLSSPQAMDKPGMLSNTVGVVLDPIVAIRRCIRIKAGDSVVATGIMGLGQNQKEAMSLLDKYQDHRLAERVFDLAWTESAVLLHQLRASEVEAQLFSKLAGAILYAGERYRASSAMIGRNQKDQSALWSYGISGDIPIVLLKITNEANLKLVAQMLKAHAYWRHKGLQVDLVIWAEAYGGYRQRLLDAIIGLVHASTESKVLDQPGGIFARNIEQIPQPDRILMEAVARVILSDRAGSLETQLEHEAHVRGEVPLLLPKRSPRGFIAEEQRLPHRELVFDNGTGGFTPDGREYVTILQPRLTTPAPWVNVLANPRFGSVVSESGSAYTWFQNAHLFRLTPWYNDPVRDRTGEAFYLRDEETGEFWSPMPLPARGGTPYVCRHGQGYTAYEHTQNRIFSETYVFVAVSAPVKFTLIKLRNLGQEKRRISVTGFCEWVLGDLRSKFAAHIQTQLDSRSGAIVARNPYNQDVAGWIGFFQCSQLERSITGDRTEFIGRNRDLHDPAAMRQSKLGNRFGAVLDPCAAIQGYVEIPPGEEREIAFILGAEEDLHKGHAVLRRYSGVDAARQERQEVWDFWKKQLGALHLETPDLSVNFLVNHWLLYQVLAARYWGRSGYYQSGGAYGFRDQLQDSMAFLHECPQFTREHIVRSCHRQFLEGDVQHWWHPPTGKGVRTCISDDYLWLPYVTAKYLDATNDTGVLAEETPYLESRLLNQGEESFYDQPVISEERGSVYQHCVRAIKYGLRFGAHGLPLMGCGDWNDGMNRVAHEGKGESVWLAFFLYDVLTNFRIVAKNHGDTDFAKYCQAEAEKLQRNIELAAWDGKWYKRAFFDDGSALGAAENDECKIDSLPQSWSILSGAGDPQRSEQALEAAQERLVDLNLRLIRLFTPPFDQTSRDPGYIKGYLPGVRENGGQYTHAAIWLVMAFASLEKSREAWHLFTLIDPVRHGNTAERIDTYKVEPYVVAADVYTAAGHEGRGGWTWYTGSAAWMYRLLVENLIGLQISQSKLIFRPLFPKGWDEFTVHYRYRSTLYHIIVRKNGDVVGRVEKIVLDEVALSGTQLQLNDDGREHSVVVLAG